MNYRELIEKTWQPDCEDEVLYAMVGVVGEAGEIANLAQKAMRGDFDPRDRKEQIICEMGGVFYFLHALCWKLGVEPIDVLMANADKLESRLKRGVIKGDGDDR